MSTRITRLDKDPKVAAAVRRWIISEWQIKLYWDKADREQQARELEQILTEAGL